MGQIKLTKAFFINKPIPKVNYSSHNKNKKINIFKNVKSNTNFDEFKKMVNKAKKRKYSLRAVDS